MKKSMKNVIVYMSLLCAFGLAFASKSMEMHFKDCSSVPFAESHNTIRGVYPSVNTSEKRNNEKG